MTTCTNEWHDEDCTYCKSSPHGYSENCVMQWHEGECPECHQVWLEG